MPIGPTGIFGGRNPGLFKLFARTYAFYLASQGQSAGQIAERTRGRSFNTATGVDVLTPQQAARNANNATRIYNERFAPFFLLGDANQIGRSLIPRAEFPDKLTSAYRYIVIGHWLRSDGFREDRPYVFDSSRNLTAGELRAQAEADIPPLPGSSRVSPSLPRGDTGEPLTWSLDTVSLTMAERRT